MKKPLKLAKKYLVAAVLLLIVGGMILPLAAAQAYGPIIIYNIVATATDKTVTISWETDRPSYGRVDYGKASNQYGWIVQTNPNQKSTSQTITIVGLDSNAQYFYRINAQDSSSDVTSLEHNFTTYLANQNNSGTNTNLVYQNQYQYSGVQVGTTNNCGVSLTNSFGFSGYYYNLPKTHPDMEGAVGPWSKPARQNDWYSQTYFVFTRIDKDLNFGSNFFPVNTGLAGDPNHFAVNWRAIIDVPTTASYTYKITADDDAWVYIDDQLVSDLNGTHMARTEEKSVQLTAGYHKLEIYYADRKIYNAVMSFTSDTRLKYHPLPMNCSVQDVINFNNQNTSQSYAYTGTNNTNGSTGQVLGASTEETQDKGVYLNGWDGVYTKFIALYRTTDSPDIWAITVNNQRLYITSPQSFNKYGLNWNKVKTISRTALEKYPVANLVKTPNNAAVYALYQKAEKKWLKLLIPTGTVFVSYPKNYWGNVVRINDLDMSAYPTANLIKVKGSAKVYQISGNTKQAFASAATFRNYGNNWADICEVNQIHADSYLDGSTLR
ncbi:MAG: PA14 domain-containing protein [Candidatus Buchananbacteria bacterium]